MLIDFPVLIARLRRGTLEERDESIDVIGPSSVHCSKYNLKSLRRRGTPEASLLHVLSCREEIL